MDSTLSGLTGVQDNVMLRQGGDIDLGAALQSNLYFTICDDISDEEYLAVNAGTPHIKQEQKDTDLSNCGHSLQYRIVNQLPKTVDEHSGASQAGSLNATTLLPTTTTVQLPSGCEIYLVKEYVESDGDNMLLSEDCEEPIALPQSVSVSSSATQTALKTPALSILPKTHIKIEPGTQTSTAPVTTSYKKRDERRRATHNEVERRRRDKINNWIFKLKEMLPKEVSSSNSSLNSKNNNNRSMNNNAAIRLPSTTMDGTEFSQQQTQPQQRNGNNCRSPPSDSKSQILIKACEYIKAMQEEVKSLHECLMENEKLRTSNNRLQIELQKLKSAERRRKEQEHNQQQHLTCDDSFDNSNNCASPSQDFAMTLCTNESDHLDEVSSSTLFATTQTSPTSITLIGGRKASISLPYKRELIITDYVD